MSRFWREGQAVEVEATPEGEPSALRRDGKRLAVLEAVDSWRVEDRWWTEALVRRDCWLLRTGEGLVEVYWAGGGWYVQRVWG